MTVLCPIGQKYLYTGMESSSDPFAIGIIGSPWNGLYYNASIVDNRLKIVGIGTGYLYMNDGTFVSVDHSNDFTINMTIRPYLMGSVGFYVKCGFVDNSIHVLTGLGIAGSWEWDPDLGSYKAKLDVIFYNNSGIGSYSYTQYLTYPLQENFVLSVKRVGDGFFGYYNGVLLFSEAYNNGTYKDNNIWLEFGGNSGSEYYIDDITVINSTSGEDCPGEIVASFSSDVTVLSRGGTVVFTDTSESVSGISTWLWDFGDGNQSTTQNPSHTYTNFGKYTVILTITGSDGEDTETKTDYVFVGPGNLDTSRSTVSYTLGLDESMLKSNEDFS